LVLRAGGLDSEHPLVCTPHLLKRRSSGTQFNLVSPMQTHQSDGNEPHVPYNDEKLLSYSACGGLSRLLQGSIKRWRRETACVNRHMGRAANGADAGSRHVTAKATSTCVLAGSEDHPDRHSMGKMGGRGLRRI
jgi:hypothetical protein